MWGPLPLEKGGGVFISYWLNAANSDPTSWKCGVVRGPYRCPKIPALRFSSCVRGELFYSYISFFISAL
jgi:hypothetical protein